MHLLKSLLFVTALSVAARAETVTVTLLATTDLHGNILPYDYFSAKPAARGLAKIATLIRAARAENPNTVLIDCGDTIQGSPIETVYQQFVRTGNFPLKIKPEGASLSADPMMLAMNHIGYDAMVLGNHEFNFGLKNLQKARSEAKFPWLSANTKAIGKARPFQQYIVKTVAGVKLAVIGLTTPAIPMWEKPQNYTGYRWEPGDKAAIATVAALRAKERPDLVIGAVHGGLDRDLKTGVVRRGETKDENPVFQIATGVPSLDAIVFGHSHRDLPGTEIGKVLIVQPKNWGISLARIDFVLERNDGTWKLISKRSRLIPVTDQTPVDEEILRLAKPYHDLTERYLNTPVAESPIEMEGTLARIQDSVLLDAVQRVQVSYSKADVSFTASFNPRVRIPRGPMTVRQIAALYIYDNELYAVQGTGKMVREALENAARYFKSCATPACTETSLINREVAAFNFDIAEGVEYEINLLKPEGQRITKLNYKGQPLADTQKLRIAINNYRAAGSAGYSMFQDAPILWRSPAEIRDLIIDYYTRERMLPAKADNNWRIIPESARTVLEREARAEAARAGTQ